MGPTDKKQKDVVMEDASDSPKNSPAADKKADQPVAKTPSELREMTIADIYVNIVLLEKAAEARETRLVNRALRTTSSLRRRLSSEILLRVLDAQYPADSPKLSALHARLAQSVNLRMDTDETRPMDADAAHPAASNEPKLSVKTKRDEIRLRASIPEVDTYLHLLVVIFLIDQKQYEQAVPLSTELVNLAIRANRITMFPLLSKSYFYYSRSYELTGRLDEIRSSLLAALRTATLRHNEEGQATIMNLLLRNLLHYNLYEQADKLLAKTPLREETSSGNQYARYLYYQGRVRAIQLDYTSAYRCLLQANRKAPETARGFRVAVHKFLCIVQLLMGEIPERSIFRLEGLKSPLKPYLQITQIVRGGLLENFNAFVARNEAIFRADRTYTLIQRLRHSVIKTGLRRINVSYSRISFKDIAAKLELGSVQDTEYIVAKAIRDGVIDAVISHAGGFIESKKSVDAYSTAEPQDAFHKRTTFCLNLHNEAVKAMRYPPRVSKGDKETLDKQKDLEKDLAEALAELDEEEDEF